MQALVRHVDLPDAVKHYALRLALATHPDTEYATELSRQYVKLGASPRGAQALILAGRVHALVEGRISVSFEDIRAHAVDALRHRVARNFEAEAEGIRTEDIVRDLLDKTSELPAHLEREAAVR